MTFFRRSDEARPDEGRQPGSGSQPGSGRQPGWLRLSLLRALLAAMAAATVLFCAPLLAAGRYAAFAGMAALAGCAGAMLAFAPALCKRERLGRALLLGWMAAECAAQLVLGGLQAGLFLPAACALAPAAAFVALPGADAAMRQRGGAGTVCALLAMAAAEVLALGHAPVACALLYAGAIVLSFTFYGAVDGLFFQALTAMEEAQRLRDALRETGESLSQAAGAKDDFLANMSHEIRTPMHAISGMADMLLMSDQLGIAERTQAENIKLASQNLLSLIGNVLDVSKIRAGKLELYEERYDFPSLLLDVTSVICMRAQEKGLLFLTDVDPDIPQEMLGDAPRIRQVLLNLLGNAVKFTDEGEVRLTARRLYRGGELALRFEVADTGCGIAQEDLGRLFGLFEQLPSTRAHNREGAGLGLSISRGLVELMGGELQVDSRVGAGSTFWFEIAQRVLRDTPIARVEHPRDARLLVVSDDERLARAAVDMAARLKVKASRGLPGDAAAYTHMLIDLSGENAYAWVRMPTPPGCRRTLLMPPASGLTAYIRPGDSVLFPPLHVVALSGALGERAAGRRPRGELLEQAGVFQTQGVRALVVDDNAVAQLVTSNLLSRYGIACDCVDGGRAALTALERAHYDVVFLDHVMPGMDGVDTVRAIRQMGARGREQAVVMLSANVMPESRRSFLSAGVTDTLAKPIELASLSRLLRRVLPPEKIAAAPAPAGPHGAAPLRALPFEGIEASLSGSAGDRARLIAAVSRGARRLTEYAAWLREAAQDPFAAMAAGPVLRCALDVLDAVGESALSAQLRLLRLQWGQGAYEGVREQLARVASWMDALGAQMADSLRQMDLPDLEDPTDLLLDAQEALRLLDLPRARAALTRLMQEGGEASRPCAQAARAALDACDWQGAATCLDQLAPLAREEDEEKGDA